MLKNTLHVSALALSLGVSGCGLLLGLGDYEDVATTGTGGTGAGPGTGASGGTGGTGATGGNGGTGGAPAPTCTDHMKNGDETATDCGGSCPMDCADGDGCMNGADCLSHVCTGGTCIAPKCDDTVQNGNETDSDCGGGGACPPCPIDDMCAVDDDCLSDSCVGGVCQSTCTDGLKGGSETGVDCGGGLVSGCMPCADTLGCAVGSDCKSGVCTALVCSSNHVFSKALGHLMNAGVGTDDSGNIVVAGTLKGSLDFGGGALSDSGGGDIAVAKLDAAGNHIWSQDFGDGAAQTLAGVAENIHGYVALAGNFSGNLGLGPGVNGNNSIFAALLDTTGGLSWVKTFPSFSGSVTRAVGILDTAQVAITGNLGGPLNFGGGALTVVGGGDIFVAKFDSVGTLTTSKSFGGAGLDEGRGIAIDAGGSVIVTGVASSSLDLGNGPLAAPGGTDIFLAQIAGFGNPNWSKGFGSTSNDAANAVTTGAMGTIYVTGLAGGDIDFGGGVIPGGVFVAKFTNGGAHVWSKSFGDPGIAAGDKIAVDTAGNVLVIGHFISSIDLGAGSVSSNGNEDVFVLKLDPLGNYLWSKTFGDVQAQLGTGIAAIDTTNLVVTGTQNGTFNMGGNTLSGASDTSFFAKFVTP